MRFEIFKSSANQQWYWRMVADNHQIIATAGEGYTTRDNAVHGMNLVRKNAASAVAYEQRPDGTWFIPA